MNKKFMSAAALLMGGVMAFTGCTAKDANSYEKIVVGTIDKEDIRLSDFNFAYYSNAAQFEQYYGMYMGVEDWESQTLEEGGQTCGEYVRESAMTEAKQLIIAEKKAKEYGITADSARKEEVKTQKDTVIQDNFGGEEKYNEYLEEYFTSDAAIERYLLRASIINDLLEEMSKEGGECAVTDDEVSYNDDTYFKVKHVLVQTSDEVSDEQALAKANEVVEKLNNGEDMSKLVEEYNDDPGMENNEYYVFTEGEMVDEFYEASKNLEIGKWTTEPVKSSYGYHVIYRYALDTSDEKFQELKTSKSQEKFMALLEEWVNDAKSTVDDKAIDDALASQKEEKKARQEAAAEEAAKAQDNTDSKDNADNDTEGEAAKNDAADDAE